MASRSKQKEEARARRLAEEQARAERERRTRRLQMLGATVGIAIVVAVVAVILSSGGGSSTKANSPQAKKNAAAVDSQLAGIPQSGARLGSPSAKVQVTEFADLQCPICKDFSEGAESQLIANEVRSGKVQLIYRSLSTATGNGPNPNIFPTQQAAALAAGEQGKAWQYIQLFYKEQGAEGTDYVNATFLENIAKQVTGLDVAKWNKDRTNPQLIAQVNQDQQQAATKGYNSTPTIVVAGAKGQAAPIVGNADYASLQAKIQSVQ
jgi:protein-disulfide isomerase